MNGKTGLGVLAVPCATIAGAHGEGATAPEETSFTLLSF